MSRTLVTSQLGEALRTEKPHATQHGWPLRVGISRAGKEEPLPEGERELEPTQAGVWLQAALQSTEAQVRACRLPDPSASSQRISSDTTSPGLKRLILWAREGQVRPRGKGAFPVHPGPDTLLRTYGHVEDSVLCGLLMLATSLG